MDIRELKNRIVDGSKRFVAKAKDAVHWVMENPEKAAAVAGAGAALFGGANKVIRNVNQNITKRQAEREKRTRIYDHSLNAYIYTKKPLTSEQIEFIHKERRRTGKKVSEILAEMNLLRR